MARMRYRRRTFRRTKCLALTPYIDQLFDQGYITFVSSDALMLSDECPSMFLMQWGFEDKIGERLIDVSVKRREYMDITIDMFLGGEHKDNGFCTRYKGSIIQFKVNG